MQFGLRQTPIRRSCDGFFAWLRTSAVRMLESTEAQRSFKRELVKTGNIFPAIMSKSLPGVQSGQRQVNNALDL
jgi:hypothetical protein